MAVKPAIRLLVDQSAAPPHPCPPELLQFPPSVPVTAASRTYADGLNMVRVTDLYSPHTFCWPDPPDPPEPPKERRPEFRPPPTPPDPGVPIDDPPGPGVPIVPSLPPVDLIIGINDCVVIDSDETEHSVAVVTNSDGEIELTPPTTTVTGYWAIPEEALEAAEMSKLVNKGFTNTAFNGWLVSQGTTPTELGTTFTYNFNPPTGTYGMYQDLLTWVFVTNVQSGKTETFNLTITIDFGEKPNIPGCTNPEATNYNPNATVDDDSCYFAPIDRADPDYGVGIGDDAATSQPFDDIIERSGEQRGNVGYSLDPEPDDDEGLGPDLGGGNPPEGGWSTGPEDQGDEICCTHNPWASTGSFRVFIEGKEAHRTGDALICGDIAGASPSRVLIG